MTEAHDPAEPILRSNLDDPRFVAPSEDAVPAEWTATDAVLAETGDPVDEFEAAIEREAIKGVRAFTAVLWLIAEFFRLVAWFFRHVVDTIRGVESRD